MRFLSRLSAALLPFTAGAAMAAASGADQVLPGEKNPLGSMGLMIGGWIMIGGLGLYCLLAFVLSMSKSMRRE
ncbi:MAG TPA: hypothetical protein VG939_01585 [Caulobacteraceae bacterium]|nr:hypothetical protein [Caulobacteraceae bacterium]